MSAFLAREPRLAAQRLGDRQQLVAVLALEGGALEGGGVHAHGGGYLWVSGEGCRSARRWDGVRRGLE